MFVHRKEKEKQLDEPTTQLIIVTEYKVLWSSNTGIKQGANEKALHKNQQLASRAQILSKLFKCVTIFSFDKLVMVFLEKQLISLGANCGNVTRNIIF